LLISGLDALSACDAPVVEIITKILIAEVYITITYFVKGVRMQYL